MTGDPTAAERQARKRAARRDAGLRRVEEYVPPERIPEFRRIAAEMREQRLGPDDQPKPPLA